jgi:hypothetical protein
MRKASDCVIAQLLFEPTPCDDAAPVRQIVDVIHFDTDPRVLVHHPQLQPIGRLDEQAFAVVRVRHRNDVGLSCGMASDPRDDLRLKEILYLGR